MYKILLWNYICQKKDITLPSWQPAFVRLKTKESNWEILKKNFEAVFRDKHLHVISRVTYDTDLYFAGSPQAADFQWRVDISRRVQKGIYEFTAVAPYLTEQKSFSGPEHEASLQHAIYFPLQLITPKFHNEVVFSKLCATPPRTD